MKAIHANLLRGLDLRHLRYFVTVAEQGGFSKAAALLNMAQPPLSAQIKDLEVMVGARLFARDKRNVALTEAGQALLPEARAVLAAAHRAVMNARQAASGQGGVLRLGLMSTAPYNQDIIRLLRRYGAAFPAVRQEPVMLPSMEQREALLCGALDLAFHWPWEGNPPRQLTTNIVRDYRFKLALARTHPLAKARRLDWRRLAEETWWTVGAQHNPFWHHFTRRYLAAAGLPSALITERDPAAFGLLPIAAGQGVGLLPEFLAVAFPQVTFRTLPELPGITNSLSLCLSRHRLRQDGVTAAFAALAAKR